MQLFLTLLYFILAVGILITVHEWGHFLVARWSGVKVLRFSLGFGKPILTYHGRKGTEYVLALIPLGGYVKMLDEEEGPVSEEEKPFAFNRKSVWARLAVVLAGPLFNMIFAVFALWLMFVIGINTLAPIVSQVKNPSAAFVTGFKPMDEVLSVANHPIQNWRDFQLEMVAQLGAKKPVAVLVKNINTKAKKTLFIHMGTWQLNPNKPDVLKSIGIQPFIPSIKPVIGQVIETGAAMKAGLKPGDKILFIDGKPITDWMQVVSLVRQSPKTPLALKVINNQLEKDIVLVPAVKKEKGKKVGFVGLMPKKTDWPTGWLRVEHYSFLHAVPRAFKETWNLTALSFKMLGKFVTGDVSLRNIGGPIGIAQGAGQSARAGMAYYLSFLALVSISLGILNILPIPMLDGGHVLFYMIEIARGRPLSEAAKQKGMAVGLMFLFALTALAVFNDVTRLMY